MDHSAALLFSAFTSGPARLAFCEDMFHGQITWRGLMRSRLDDAGMPRFVRRTRRRAGYDLILLCLKLYGGSVDRALSIIGPKNAHFANNFSCFGVYMKDLNVLLMGVW